ncbi:hypothetical protein [Mycobacterium sp. 155]|uniref:hypothetical protein n=1 Tax=Mycobacterium sp. 155 TaxID=1157943 RepID=UPI00037A88B6|nr:hypothetical protein [Mycobacterium sp. 155]
MFENLGLPGPSKIGNAFTTLSRAGYIAKGSAQGLWRITPLGRHHSNSVVTESELHELLAETQSYGGALLGAVMHTLVPPTLAPPAIVAPVTRFTETYPFDLNVFGMTRFPDDSGDDPVDTALSAARTELERHGLSFHLASDRAMSDDLWTNVAAHMWASRYGIAIFEDRRGRGLNYNLTIEVGGMVITGRRCLLLKDTSIQSMPTDLVGMIYKAVDLDKPETVTKAVADWVKNDLHLAA